MFKKKETAASGSFNASYLPAFGNKYVDKLVGATLDNAEIAAPQSVEQEQIDGIVTDYRDGVLKMVNCADITTILESIGDEELKETLGRQTQAIAQHSKWNGAFAVKMKNFRPYDKTKRLDYAHGLLEAGKTENSYPSANSLNIVLQNSRNLAIAERELEALEKRGVIPNAKSLDLLLSLAKSREEAGAIFEKYSPKTGVNAYVMNRMIKFCDGVDEARQIIKDHFAVSGLQLNHGSLLSLVSCSRDADEADRVMASLVGELGHSTYLLNARVAHDGDIVAQEATVKSIEQASYETGKAIRADSTTFAIIAKKAIDNGDIAVAQHYLSKAEKAQAAEKKKPTRFMGYLKKTLAKKTAEQQQDQPDKTASPDSL